MFSIISLASWPIAQRSSATRSPWRRHPFVDRSGSWRIPLLAEGAFRATIRWFTGLRRPVASAPGSLVVIAIHLSLLGGGQTAGVKKPLTYVRGFDKRLADVGQGRHSLPYVRGFDKRLPPVGQGRHSLPYVPYKINYSCLW